MIKHKHHIIPKHAGGSDDPSNIVELSIEDHAETHRILFESYGRWQDEIAWKALSGQISRAEAINLAQKNGDRTWMKTDVGKEILQKSNEKKKGKAPWNKGLTKKSSQIVQKYSDNLRKTMLSGNVKTIGDTMRGKTFTEEHRKKLSHAKKHEPKKECEYCNKKIASGMYARWHGEKCKYKTSDK